jgi:ABC-2 type transport system ATP-binding protein
MRNSTSGQPTISVQGLRKRYGQQEAVRGIDLQVRAGEVFAFLGPNGAGKTTTVEILEGYRARDAGQVEVLGVDPAAADRAWRARIGVVLQSGQTQPALTVRETIEQFAGYYPSPRPVQETIEMVGLAEQAAVRVRRLSGGQRRRLDVALGLIGDPEVLFLDEPTTGFDPAARRNAWRTISGLRQLGTTIFLTTHYIEEAQELADRVAIIVAGRIVAEGPPAELLARGRRELQVSFQLPEGLTATDLPAGLDGELTVRGDRVELRTPTPVHALNLLTGWALQRGVDLPELEVRRGRLEDVYLELTEGG